MKLLACLSQPFLASMRRRLVLNTFGLLAGIATSALLACPAEAATHTISGTKILRDGVSAQWRGVNAPNMSGLQASSMGGWGIDIIREYISDVNDVPVGDTSIQDPSTGQWIHGLRRIVNDNRANGKVTILCPFSWNIDGGWEEEYCGKTPRERWFYNDHVNRLRAWAWEFRNDSDVWISLWNEPYSGNSGDYDAWLTDSAEMVDAIRSQSNNNIIVVPVSNWAQDEGVLFSKGNALKSGRSNLLFDIHCYAGWNDWQSQGDIQNRFQAVKNAGFAAMVGEVGAVIGYWNNQWQVRDVAKVLNAAANTGMTCLAWHWKDSSELDSLRRNGQPNNVNNFNFGSTVRNYCLASRTPDTSGSLVSGGVYKITARHSGKALDAFGNANGGDIGQWGYGGGANQKWKVTSVGSGQYKVEEQRGFRALDVEVASMANGGRVHLWTYGGGANQKWVITPTDGGYYKVVAAHSGKALDVSGVSSANGALVHQWEYVGGWNQQWAFEAQ